MMHLEIGGARVPVPAGETIIGSAPGSAIVLEGEGVQPRHAILLGTPQGAAAIRAAAPGRGPARQRRAARRRPHPGAPRRQDPDRPARDPRRRRPPHRPHPALRLRRLHRPCPVRPSLRQPAGHRAAGWSASPTGASTRSAASGWCSAVTPARDVVVGGTEVSRRHAEIERISEGYVLNDFSVNGTYVNGERVGRQHLLARADVIRIGHDEFRLYADVALPTPRALAAACPRR